MLRIQLDSQIEDLEQKFENAHLNYLQTTDQRTSDFKFYTKKDQELSKDIEVQFVRRAGMRVLSPPRPAHAVAPSSPNPPHSTLT